MIVENIQRSPQYSVGTVCSLSWLMSIKMQSAGLPLMRNLKSTSLACTKSLTDSLMGVMPGRASRTSENSRYREVSQKIHQFCTHASSENFLMQEEEPAGQETCNLNGQSLSFVSKTVAHAGTSRPVDT